MFTGIVDDVGEVLSIEPRQAGMRLVIATRYDPEGIALGASIACSGPCLTVVERGYRGDRACFAVDASSETLARTTMSAWRQGRRINLERSLRLGDELGGHMVTGHVDGTATIVERREDGGMAAFTLEIAADLSRYVVEKGSVSLDGTSLTVNGVDGRRFDVMLVPHTLTVTTWGERQAGDAVNLEVDLVARYLAGLHRAV